jgi:oxygen-independent coproporphyrinogen-3 oxidase
LKNLIPERVPLSLYIHFPWCEKKCPYCDFNIDTNKKDGDEESLVKAILKDLDMSHDYIAGRKFTSVYFGGGTPSLISPKIIEQITNKLKKLNLVEDDCEVSFELNPKEVDKNYLGDLIDIGINRVSIGIQSFDQDILNILERNHGSQDAINALEVVSGFKSIDTTIDLIYGNMEQTLESFVADINKFCSFNIDHLSLYQLTIEPNTIFYKKELIMPEDTLIESMEIAAKEILNKNNLYQYEVSSWAKKGRQSKHNMNYWMYGDYLGLGPGAHSKITMKNSITRMIKLKKVGSYINNPSKTLNTSITSETYDLDLAMNLLRIKDGISFKDLTSKNIYLPESFLRKLKKGVNESLLEESGIKATNMGYKFLNDTVNIFN